MKLLLILLFILNAFYTSAQDTSSYMSRSIKVLEVLQGFEYKQNEITIIVRSSGCTEKRDFRVEHNLVGDFAMISFYRIHEDLCRASPNDQPITYTEAELLLDKGKKLVLNNSFYPAVIYNR